MTGLLILGGAMIGYGVKGLVNFGKVIIAKKAMQNAEVEVEAAPEIQECAEAAEGKNINSDEVE